MSNSAPIMVDPRVETTRAKVAIRVAIRRETKSRTRKAAKAVRNAWKHDSTYRRLVKAKKQADKALQSADDKLKEMRQEEAELLAKIRSEITLPNVCTDLILRPKWVSPVSPLNLDFVFAPSITQSMITNSLPPPIPLDVTLPHAVLSISTALCIYPAPVPQHKCAKIFLPPRTNFSPSPPQSLDLTPPESTPNSTTLDLLIESMCAEFGIQTTIPTKTKTHTKEPTGPLRTVWTHDRRSVKVETQADIALKTDNEKLEMYREEAIPWAKKDPEIDPPNTCTKLISPQSLDLTPPESTPNSTTLDLLIESMCAEFGIQTTIPTKTKTHTKKPTGPLRTVWTHDRRSVKAETQADIALQTDNEKLEEMYREEAILWAKKDPEIDPPNTCTNLILRPKRVSPFVPLTPDFGLVSLIMHSKAANCQLPPTISDFILSQAISSILASLSIHPAPAQQPKRPKPIFPPPGENPSSPSLDHTTPETAPENTMIDPRIRVIRAKIAVQTKFQTESKARIKKSSKALKNTWKRDRRAVKARKQADKALQNATDTIAELRCEEVRIVAEIRREEAKVLSEKGGM